MDLDELPVLPAATGVRRITRRLGRPVRAWVAGAALAVQQPGSGGRSTIAIGDSHAVLLLDGWMPSPTVVRRDGSATTLYLGPRLMYSVAQRGWPAWVHRLVRLRLRSPLARGPLQLVLVLGEIDVRCQLGQDGRGDDAALEALADDYVARAVGLLDVLRSTDSVVVLGPNPPSESYVELYQGYPVVGSVAERSQLLDGLCRHLRAATERSGDQRLRFLDVRPLVAADDGSLRAELTFDGCHLNRTGAALVRAVLADLEPARD